MFKFLTVAFVATMEGTVDQIDSNRAVVEITAKDNHIHEAEFPIWIFPCKVEEGTVFRIDIFKDKVTIRCNKENR